MENSLLKQFCDGNNDVLQEVCPSIIEDCYLRAIPITKHKENAEDIVQETLLKILQLPPQVRHQRFIQEQINLRAYILMSVRNKAFDYYNKHKTRSRILALFGVNNNNIHWEILKDEDWKNVFKILNPMEESIFDLHLQGYSNEEIATQKNMAYKTVANILSATRKKVRQYWLSL